MSFESYHLWIVVAAIPVVLAPRGQYRCEEFHFEKHTRALGRHQDTNTRRVN